MFELDMNRIDIIVVTPRSVTVLDCPALRPRNIIQRIHVVDRE